MPKNAVQRLQKIESDLKTVISIYEVFNKNKNTQDKLKKPKDEFPPQLPQINTQVLESNTFYNEAREPQTAVLDISKDTVSVIAQTTQDITEPVQTIKNCKVQKPGATPTSFNALSTICEVSYVKTKQTDDENKIPVHDSDAVIKQTNITLRSKEKENRTATPIKSHLVSSGENSVQKEYPDWLIRATSDWFGAIKHSHNSDKDKHSSNNSLIPVKMSKNLSSPEEENTRRVKNLQDKIKNKKKLFVSDKVNTKQNKNMAGKEKEKARKTQNEESWTNELHKMIDKSNEKLKKMKASKELALDIAKHLKEKYDKIQQSKQEMMEELHKVQKDNERLRSELQEFRAKQIEEDGKNKENPQELKERISELEKELLEKQRDIDEIQRVRLTEMRNELENKENQAKDIQRLSNEKCQLLTRNEKLSVLLTDRHLEKQFLLQRIRQLEEEVQTQKQQTIKKAKALQETNTELEIIRENTRVLEQQVEMLRKNIEEYEETQKNLQKQTEEYEQQSKSKQQQIDKLQEENINLKNELEKQKDTLLIKAKIIEDQQETIKQLKEKSEEVKSLLKQKESLERVLNTEREEKLELEEAVECLKKRKEELKRKIKTLESDIISAPQDVAQDLQKTQAILSELENQFYIKQKDWELQLQSLIREKEQACSIAEFATKKLIRTSSKFQKQSEAHKKLRRILSENFAEKGQHYWKQTQNSKNPEFFSS